MGILLIPVLCLGLGIVFEKTFRGITIRLKKPMPRLVAILTTVISLMTIFWVEKPFPSGMPEITEELAITIINPTDDPGETTGESPSILIIHEGGYLNEGQCHGGGWQRGDDGFFYTISPSYGTLMCQITGLPRSEVSIQFTHGSIGTKAEVMLGEYIELVELSSLGDQAILLFHLPHIARSLVSVIADTISWMSIAIVIGGLYMQYERTLVFSALVLAVISTAYLVSYPLLNRAYNQLSRIDLQLRTWPGMSGETYFLGMLMAVEENVPSGATLAIIIPGKYPVSPLFGEHYTRQLLPLYPAPENLSATLMHNLHAEYLLVLGDLFDPGLVSADGMIHFEEFGPNVIYPYYSLEDTLDAGLQVVESCFDTTACGSRYYLFTTERGK